MGFMRIRNGISKRHRNRSGIRDTDLTGFGVSRIMTHRDAGFPNVPERIP